MFAKNVAVVMSGTAVAQIVSFGMTPVISRFFTPSDFGVFGSFNAVLIVICAAVTLQYSQAIMLPKDDKDAINVFAISIASVILVTLIVSLVVFITSTMLTSLVKIDSSYFLLWLLPLGIFLNGLNQSFQAWCIRRKAFSRTSVSQVIRAISMNISQISLGIFRIGGIGLISGSVFGDGMATISVARFFFKNDYSQMRHAIKWQKMKEMVVEYRDFPMFSSPQNVFNALSQGLPVLLLGYFYGVAVAGSYAFGSRILQAPMAFVLVALRQVLFQKASEAYNSGQKLYPLYLKTTGGLFAIAIIPSVVLFIWAPSIFSLIFGSKWYMAGDYARWLVLWLAFLFCNLPSTLFAAILRQQRNLFFYEIVVLITRTSALVIGGLFFSAKESIIMFSIAGCLLNLVYIFWIGNLVRKKSGESISNIEEKSFSKIGAESEF
ncbi:MAG: oligosaccharide flippase family protein [Planctomycetes bacterium]|nr:oligosaccharide flippase family protein [Planctomycetota bacterium]